MGQILSQPVTEKATEKGEDSRHVFGVSSMQGWRVSMEDAHAAILTLSSDPHVSFFAVYDGHGGDRTAAYAGEHVHELVRDSDAFARGDWGQALTDGFLGLDNALLNDEKEAPDNSGCAATAVIVTDSTVVCANAGDSRSVLGRRGTAKPLSFDHKPENEGERSRIHAGGGFVELGRVNGNLALSRALGDFPFKKNASMPPEQQVVTANPDIIDHSIDENDEFLVLACDGIWDCLTSQQVVEFVRRGIADKLSLEDICELLMEECLSPESDMSGIGCDNMTVCVVALLQNGQSKEEWYEMIAQRVAAGDGRVATRHSDEVKRQQQARQSPQRRKSPGFDGAGSAASGDFDDDSGAGDSASMINAAPLIQQIFGGGNEQLRLDPETTSILSQLGFQFNVHSAEDDDDQIAESEDGSGSSDPEAKPDALDAHEIHEVHEAHANEDASESTTITRGGDA